MDRPAIPKRALKMEKTHRPPIPKRSMIFFLQRYPNSFTTDPQFNVIQTPTVPQKSSRSKLDAPKRDWAQVIDVSRPFRDFHRKVPHMAHKV
jgi:hypothetical protein